LYNTINKSAADKFNGTFLFGKALNMQKEITIPVREKENIVTDVEISVKKERYHILDTVRGTALINMILFHALWDIVYIYEHNIEWYRGIVGGIWQKMICITFIVLSGFCFNLGKKKFKRGLTVFLGGLAVTVVTLIFMPQDRVLFGILTMLGSSMLIMFMLDKPFKKIDPFAGTIISLVLFILSGNIDMGYIGIGSIEFVRLPSTIYSNLFTAYLGFPPRGFYSSDYFGIIPWFLLFCCGYFVYRIAEKHNILKYLSGGKCAVLEWFGRHSLIVYLLHQPVVMLFLQMFHIIFMRESM